jgi:hypothetical protein
MVYANAKLDRGVADLIRHVAFERERQRRQECGKRAWLSRKLVAVPANGGFAGVRSGPSGRAGAGIKFL